MDWDGAYDSEFQFMGLPDFDTDLFGGIVDHFPDVRAADLRTSELAYLCNCAANSKLGMPETLNILVWMVAARLRWGTTEENRETLGCVNDFTPEDIEEYERGVLKRINGPNA